MVKDRDHVPTPSPAKAAIARVKPRDAQGHFLSGEALQAYQQQQQQQQMQGERDRLNALLGRGSGGMMPQQPMQQQPTQQQYPQSTDNSAFQSILRSNIPGQRQGEQPMTDDEKWEQLLGKKKRQNGWL